jgi:hypothetical protein
MTSRQLLPSHDPEPRDESNSTIDYWYRQPGSATDQSGVEARVVLISAGFWVGSAVCSGHVRCPIGTSSASGWQWLDSIHGDFVPDDPGIHRRPHVTTPPSGRDLGGQHAIGGLPCRSHVVGMRDSLPRLEPTPALGTTKCSGSRF